MRKSSEKIVIKNQKKTIIYCSKLQFYQKHFIFDLGWLIVLQKSNKKQKTKKSIEKLKQLILNKAENV